MGEIDRAFAPIYRLVGQAPIDTRVRLERVAPTPEFAWPLSPSIAELTGLRLDDASRRWLKDHDWSPEQDWSEVSDAENDVEIIDSYYWAHEYPDLLREASAYYITPDISVVLDVAAASLPEAFILRAEHVPTQLGVVALGRWVDAVGEYPIDSFYWHLLPYGVIVSVFGPTADRFNWPFPSSLYTFSLPFGRSLIEVMSAAESTQDEDELPWVRWLVSLWLFIVQKLPATERRRAPRNLRRHDLKDAPTLHHTTFVTLRRRHARASDDHADIDWTHRWIVTGHWREQYYPSTDEHHTIWIAPYVKGPDDLPLVPKDRAFMVSR